MKRLIEFSLGDENTILVEVEEPVEEGIRRVARSDSHEVVEKAKQSFDAALDKIKPAAATIIAKLSSLPDKPNEVEVKFGIKMSAAAGAIIAAAGVEANYEITLKWKREGTG